VNAVGARTLLRKEIRRFLRVPGQTLASPLVSTALYFLVFGLALGARQQLTGEVPYLHFIVPGLVFMGVANNAFMNSSTSLFICKLQGTVVDLLAAPLGPGELLYGFIVGAMVRGVMVGVLTWCVAWAFAGPLLASPVVTIFFLLLTAYVFSLLGFLVALWSDKFEQVNIFPTFIMLPLTFLGGVFYPVHALPEPWRTLSLANPVVHMVEGLRGGMLGAAQGGTLVGAVLLVVLAAGSTALAVRLLATGYKLKS
jgi:ABC-2 type transport system permease protein